MKLRDLFQSRPDAKPVSAQEPHLEPSPQRSEGTTSRNQRLSQALALMADSIAAQEVQDLVADMPGARYHLLTLTLWVSAANAQVLRSLMDLAQRDQASAITLLHHGFAKAGTRAAVRCSR